MDESATGKDFMPPPYKPSRGAMLASCLEISILLTLVHEGSWSGVLLCAAYGYYSSTWFIVAMMIAEGEG
jgi:hypothetical protein